jgi:hypothetical protein
MLDLGVIPVCQPEKDEFIRSFPNVFSATPNGQNVSSPFSTVPARPADDPRPCP